MTNKCQVCEKELPPPKRSIHDRRFCGQTCRLIAWAERKKEALKKNKHGVK